MVKTLSRILSLLVGAALAIPLASWAQDWYQHSGVPVQRSALNSADLRTEFAAIETAMDKLPALAGNGGKLVAVNASGTALETLSSGLTVAQGGTGATTLTGLLQGNGTSAITGIANSSTVGQVLRVTGASTYGWGALDLADADAITGDLPDGNLSGNVPLLNATNTFSVSQNISAAAPQLRLIETGVTADNTSWSWTADGEQFSGRLWNDALSSQTAWLTVDRTANTADLIALAGTEIDLTATTLDFNGNADFSGSLFTNGNATFAGSYALLSNTLPELRWTETDATAGNQNWLILANDEQWVFRIYDDTFTTSAKVFAVDRTGNTVDEVEINGTTLDFNGNADISGSLVLGTDLAIADGGTGASTAANARTNLGLGSLATLSTINDSNWSGADLALANGGTGASLVDPNADRIFFWDDSAGATTFLTVGSGLQITGTTIESTAGGGTVTSVSGAGTVNGLTLTGTVTTTGSLTLGGTLAINNADWSGTDLSVANGGTGASTLTGLLQGNGTSAITGIANSSTVGQVLRVTGASTYGWGALDLADADAITGDLPDANLSANLTAIAGLSVADNNFIVGNGASWVAESGATARTSLGLGALATLNTINSTALIDNEIVTNAKLADMAVNTIKGRITAGTGDAEDLTAAQVIDIIETADGAGSGLDADTLDGTSSAGFATASHTHATGDVTSGTFADARIASSNVTQHMDDGYARNITGKAGVAKTLLANASCPPTGGSDGDIWLCY